MKNPSKDKTLSLINTEDVEVKPRPTRRRFNAAYKRRIVQECNEAPRGQIGAILRREGLYSSTLSVWRKQIEQAKINALEPKRRGRLPNPDKALIDELALLKRQNASLTHRLAQAEKIVEVQKKVSELLGISLTETDEAT